MRPVYLVQIRCTVVFYGGRPPKQMPKSVNRNDVTNRNKATDQVLHLSHMRIAVGGAKIALRSTGEKELAPLAYCGPVNL